ncbi:hypothetical protein SISSUDRAFT_1011873 [Sistotremastrum suecicum HHB10207 ss-3]|uniref:Cytochrome C oxidase copper chaperone n=1 Tax=Sistotremastrum suecicum HHB10207 ss-3 TaxID=1314776 RepID=A0A165XNL8_9AGAM|nr:hypothetical protein SISSUDRAFT_1011873 [Sistotremastrum suecicum HHB10207 ss-3]
MFGFFSGSKAPTEVAQADLSSCPVKPAVNPLNPEGIKPCCACPETKSARDACFFNTDPSEADQKCIELVRAHVACMKSYGFNI